MAFQFARDGAPEPPVRAAFDSGPADLRLLIGLHLSPGVVLGLPSGALGRRFCDKTCVLAGFAAMTLGGVAMVLLPGWPAQISGRLLAGLGGVMLNVMMAKMVADWFSGREIATAMGLYGNPWPLGARWRWFRCRL